MAAFLDALVEMVRRMVGIRAEGELFKRRTCKGGLKFICKMCGREFSGERGVEAHIRQKHQSKLVEMMLRKDLEGVKGTKRDMEEIEILLKNMDAERLIGLDVDIGKAEGLAKMWNELFFHGDWEKHIEWTRKYGSEEQKREDIPLLKRLMREEMRKPKAR